MATEPEKPLSQIRKDDTLVVCKLDRLARSTHHLLEIVEILREKKQHSILWENLGQIRRIKRMDRERDFANPQNFFLRQTS